MSRIQRFSIGLAAICVLILNACGTTTGDTTTPDGNMRASISALQENDVKGLLEVLLPAEQLAEMRSEFAAKPAMDEEEKAEFNEKLAMITAEGAEDMLFAMAQPMLPEAQVQVQQAAGMVMMLAGMAMQDEEMDPEEQAQMTQTIQAIQGWLAGLDVTDEAKLKEAIGIVCSTARSLDIADADAMEALSFDQALSKAGTALGGAKQVLALYGLDIDASLKSIQIGEATIEGDTARVPVTSTVFGQTMTNTAVLKQVDGRWIAAPLADDEDDAQADDLD